MVAALNRVANLTGLTGTDIDVASVPPRRLLGFRSVVTRGSNAARRYQAAHPGTPYTVALRPREDDTTLEGLIDWLRTQL